MFKDQLIFLLTEIFSFHCEELKQTYKLFMLATGIS